MKSTKRINAMSATTTNTLYKMVITLNGNVEPTRFARTVEKMLACYNTYGDKEI